MNPCTRKNVEWSSLENTRPLPLKETAGAAVGPGTAVAAAVVAGDGAAEGAGDVSAAGSEFGSAYTDDVNNRATANNKLAIRMSFSWEP